MTYTVSTFQTPYRIMKINAPVLRHRDLLALETSQWPMLSLTNDNGQNLLIVPKKASPYCCCYHGNSIRSGRYLCIARFQKKSFLKTELQPWSACSRAVRKQATKNNHDNPHPSFLTSCGAVRRALLGLPVVDHDWSSQAPHQNTWTESYQQLAKQFPVFLHPRSKRRIRPCSAKEKKQRLKLTLVLFVTLLPTFA